MWFKCEDLRKGKQRLLCFARFDLLMMLHPRSQLRANTATSSLPLLVPNVNGALIRRKNMAHRYSASSANNGAPSIAKTWKAAKRWTANCFVGCAHFHTSELWPRQPNIRTPPCDTPQITNETHQIVPRLRVTSMAPFCIYTFELTAFLCWQIKGCQQ